MYELFKNKVILQEVRDYFENTLKQEAIRKVFEGEDVSAVKEARDIINISFENIELLFQSNEKKHKINEAC